MYIVRVAFSVLRCRTQRVSVARQQRPAVTVTPPSLAVALPGSLQERSHLRGGLQVCRNVPRPRHPVARDRGEVEAPVPDRHVEDRLQRGEHLVRARHSEAAPAQASPSRTARPPLQ